MLGQEEETMKLCIDIDGVLAMEGDDPVQGRGTSRGFVIERSLASSG